MWCEQIQERRTMQAEHNTGQHEQRVQVESLGAGQFVYTNTAPT